MYCIAYKVLWLEAWYHCTNLLVVRTKSISLCKNFLVEKAFYQDSF